MSQRFESEFGTLIIPAAYPSVKVQASVSGLATTGVVAIIGEADGGAPGSEETTDENFFGPDQLAAVQSKYLSGNIVNAFRALAAPANDPHIQGSVQRIYIYKTNASTQASGLLSNAGLGSYGTNEDSNWGQNGNLINHRVLSAQQEVEPTSGSFSYIPSPSGATMLLRVNGGSEVSVAVGALAAPSALASSLEGVAGVVAQGGVNQDILNGLSGTDITITVSGNDLTATLASGSVFDSTPSIGDTLLVAALGDYSAVADSVYSGAADANQGAYVVTSVTNTVSSAFITAEKLRNDAVGALTPPVAVGAASISANEDDLICFSSLSFSDATGDDRDILNGLTGQDIIISVSGANLTATLASGQVWDSEPQLGDFIEIPAGSPYIGGVSANVGHYEVTVVSNTVVSAFITATRLSNGNPVAVGAAAIAASSDLQCLRPQKAGLGKAIEVSDGAGTDNISTILRNLGQSTSVSWISTAGTPALLESSAEYIAQVNVNRQFDNIQESFSAGGDIGLEVGYLGTTGSLTISSTLMTTTVVGGSGANLSLTLADFPTLSDLATYIDSQTGYSAQVGNTLLGQKSPSGLDIGTYGICSSVSAESRSGRVKRDLASFEEEIGQSILVSFTAASSAAGLPDVMSSQVFLSGGAKGGSTSANVISGLTDLEGVAANFIVPLFSQDGSEDITDGLTESSSTYTVAAVHQAVKDHIISMSAVKLRRNRQGFLSRKGTFLEAKQSANSMASARLSMVFQDFKGLASTGEIEQFQPWYGACLAAGMQGAGFYKAIVKKFINAPSVLQAAADFSDNTPSQIEDALKNGLLPAEKVLTGGIRWISDQTTYAIDSNFVYNSIQAVYASDVIALSLAERMERAFVGQSVADVSAVAAIGFINAVMFEFLRLKLLAPSDDAPSGFKDLVVKIVGPAMQVSMEIKLATAIYFIPISFTVSQVEQTASL